MLALSVAALTRAVPNLAHIGMGLQSAGLYSYGAYGYGRYSYGRYGRGLYVCSPRDDSRIHTSTRVDADAYTHVRARVHTRVRTHTRAPQCPVWASEGRCDSDPRHISYGILVMAY